jgi:phage-related protein
MNCRSDQLNVNREKFNVERTQRKEEMQKLKEMIKDERRV